MFSKIRHVARVLFRPKYRRAHKRHKQDNKRFAQCMAVCKAGK